MGRRRRGTKKRLARHLRSEAMRMICKGQLRGLAKGAMLGQRTFLHALFGIADWPPGDLSLSHRDARSNSTSSWRGQYSGAGSCQTDTLRAASAVIAHGK